MLKSAVIAVMLLFACERSAWALPPELSFNQLHHTAWTIRDGAPPGAGALAQTKDGALWLGATTGLFRFDGVRFERFAFDNRLAGDVSALFASDDGGLWIGMRFGSIFFLKDGQLRAHGREEYLPGRSIFGFATGADGTIWAASVGGLFHLEAGRWRRLGEESGITGDYFTNLLLDGNKTLWAVGPAGLFALAAGENKFQKLDVPGEFAFLDETLDGSLWFVGLNSALFSLTQRLRNPSATPPGVWPPLAEGIGFAVGDRDGGIWFAIGKTLARIATPRSLPALTKEVVPTVVQRFGAEQGLSADYVRAILEDDAGNIWVTTNGGLDRFRAPKLQTVDQPYALDGILAERPDGSIWLASYASGLVQLDSTRRAPIGSELHISALHAESDGTFLIGGWDGLFRFHQGVLKAIELPVSPPDNLVQAITRGRDGTLWVGLIRKGVFCARNNGWQQRCGIDQLPGDCPLAIVADDQDRMWFGYPGSHVARWDSKTLVQFTSEDGFTVGDVHAILPSRDEVWIGGSGGLAHIAKDRVMTVTGAENERFEGISGMVVSKDGSLWLNATAGIVRIPAGELQSFRRDRSHTPSYERFDHNDGLRGVAQQVRPLPSAFRDSTGRLWFSTSMNIHWIDPERIPRNDVAPVVEVRRISANGIDYPITDPVILPVGTDAFEIDYTALALSIPDKVRFQYQLEGLERSWQNGGTRRTAFYTNVSHGQYRFNIAAANEDGVWSAPGAGITILVPPRYYQTLWFKVICVVLAATMLWQFHRYRAHRIAITERSRLEGRQQERERIARDLHDTLLQGTQALILAFHSIVKDLPQGSSLRDRCERSLDRADQMLGEARDKVQELRADEAMQEDIARSLTLACEELLEWSANTRVVHRVDGVQRELRRTLREQIYRIGREALVNAFKHSQATTIEVTVTFGLRQFKLSVRDDGIGGDHESVVTNAGDRHWGIRGMHERARSLGGELRIFKNHPSGLAVELIIAAASAYEPNRKFRISRYWPRWWRRDGTVGHPPKE